MSEPRKLNTGDARSIHRAPQAQPAAGMAGSGRSVRTAQAHSGTQAPAAPAAAAPDAATGQRAYPYSAPAYQPPAAAPAQEAYRPQTPSYNGAYAPPARAQAPAAPDAYEQARRRAQADADQTARLRRIQQGSARPKGNTHELTPTQRQAIAMRRAAQQQAQQPAALRPRTDAARNQGYARPAPQQRPARPAQPEEPAAGQAVRSARAPAPRAQAPATPAEPRHIAPAAPRRQAYDFDRDQPPAGPDVSGLYGGAHAKPAHHAPHRDAQADAEPPAGQGRRHKAEKERPPRAVKKDKGSPNSSKKGRHGGSGGQDGGKKRKLKWWQIALVTLLIIVLILGGTFFLIWHAIAPPMGTLSLNNMFNTPKEFKGKELNFLMVGVDRSTESGDSSDKDVGDGNTDMIMYVHFNNETGEMKMLQIPRDYLVSTDRSVSRNFKLNNVAMTQATQPGTLNLPALCEQVSKMFQIPIDGYVSIRMEMLTELVDAFEFVELYIPQDISYGGSKLEKGYRLLRSDQVEFLLRNRKSYADGDITRLNMQRQFYSAMFRRLKSMSVWDVARVAPVILNYMETDLSATQLVGFAVSMLRIESSKIMICQMPVYMMGNRTFYKGDSADGETGQSVVYPARQEAADLLNTYFRENSGPVDASQLQLCEPTSDAQGPFGVRSQMSLTDPNIQFMKDINDQQNDARLNDNPDGVYTIDYVDPDAPATPAPDASSPDASSPAA